MNEEMQLKYAKLIAACWMNEQLMDRLRKEPAAVLAEHGIVIPGSDSKKIIIVEDTQDTMHLVFPCKPAQQDQPPTHWPDLCCLPR